MNIEELQVYQLSMEIAEKFGILFTDGISLKKILSESKW